MASVALTRQQKAEKRYRSGCRTMFFGCILLFINATLQLLTFAWAFLYKLLPSGEIWDLIKASFDASWQDPTQIVQFLWAPIMAIFLILAGIGGISWIKDKGPLMSFAPLMAMISLVFIVVNLFLDLRKYIMNGFDWFNLILDFLDIQFTCGFFFFGWLKAKDKID